MPQKCYKTPNNAFLKMNRKNHFDQKMHSDWPIMLVDAKMSLTEIQNKGSHFLVAFLLFFSENLEKFVIFTMKEGILSIGMTSGKNMF